VTFEFPHLMRLLEATSSTLFTTSTTRTSPAHDREDLSRAHGLTLFDVEELWTHGGSLRIYARHASDSSRPASSRLLALREREDAGGYRRIET